jgi:F-type H+-transporting ATPase subunit b
MLAQYEAKLAGAADQVRAMLDEARRDSETTKATIIAEAKAAAEVEVERGRRDIRTATDVAVQELATKAGDLAVDLAGKVLQAKISKDDHARLLADGMSKFVASAPSKN